MKLSLLLVGSVLYWGCVTSVEWGQDFGIIKSLKFCSKAVKSGWKKEFRALQNASEAV